MDIAVAENSVSADIQHSLESHVIELLTTARFFKLDPDVVFKWSMPHYTDRREYMDISEEIELQRHQKAHRNQPRPKNGMIPLAPGEVEYRPKK